MRHVQIECRSDVFTSVESRLGMLVSAGKHFQNPTTMHYCTLIS
jgi:hypothetical protein